MNLYAKKITASALTIVFCTAAFAQAQSLLPVPRTQPYRPVWTQYTPSHVHQYQRTTHSIANSYNVVRNQYIPVQRGIGYQPAIASRAPYYPIQPAIVTPPQSVGVPVLLADQLPMQTVPVIEFGSPAVVSSQPRVLDGFGNVAFAEDSTVVGGRQVGSESQAMIDLGSAPAAPTQANYEEAVSNKVIGEVVNENTVEQVEVAGSVAADALGEVANSQSDTMESAIEMETTDSPVESAVEISPVAQVDEPGKVEQMDLDSARATQNKESKETKAGSDSDIDGSAKMTLAKLAEIKRVERNAAQQAGMNLEATASADSPNHELESEMQSQVTRLTESIRERFEKKIERAARSGNGEEKIESLKNEMNIQIEKMTDRIENRFKNRLEK